MSKEEVYQLIKEKTYKLKDENGVQITITSEEMLSPEAKLDLNEQTLFHNLKGLKKSNDIHYIINKITRYKEGRKITFNQTIWWVE